MAHGKWRWRKSEIAAAPACYVIQCLEAFWLSCKHDRQIPGNEATLCPLPVTSAGTHALECGRRGRSSIWTLKVFFLHFPASMFAFASFVCPFLSTARPILGAANTPSAIGAQPSLSSLTSQGNTNRQCLISVINSAPAALEKEKIGKTNHPPPPRLLALEEAAERWGH